MKLMMTGAFTPGAPGAWMWAMVAGAASPAKFRFTVTIVCAWFRTTIPDPVAVLPVGGTSWAPFSVAANT